MLRLRGAAALLALALTDCAPALPAEAAPLAAPRERSRDDARGRGVAWLLAHEDPAGGWSSGGYGDTGPRPDVATTAIAVLALQRDEGGLRTHDAAVRRGVSLVVAAVEHAPPDGPLLDTPSGTQIQRKLGPYVDTHLAALMLGETLPRLDGALATRARSALSVAVAKTVRTQGPDGAFGAGGWAPVLSSTLAAQGLTSALSRSLAVDGDVLARSDGYLRSLVDLERLTFTSARGAGVPLYAVASALRGNDLTMARTGPAAASPRDRALAHAARGLALEAVVEDESGRLVTGFGSFGGEETLSYLLISETLAGIGGPFWEKWDAQVGELLVQAQGNDGSWSGHHCITSQPFTTAAAILTLTTGQPGRDPPRSPAVTPAPPTAR